MFSKWQKLLIWDFKNFTTKCRACLLSGSNDSILRGGLCTLCETSVLPHDLFSHFWAGDVWTLETLYALCLNGWDICSFARPLFSNLGWWCKPIARANKSTFCRFHRWNILIERGKWDLISYRGCRLKFLLVSSSFCGSILCSIHHSPQASSFLWWCFRSTTAATAAAASTMSSIPIPVLHCITFSPSVPAEVFRRAQIYCFAVLTNTLLFLCLALLLSTPLSFAILKQNLYLDSEAGHHRDSLAGVNC